MFRYRMHTRSSRLGIVVVLIVVGLLLLWIAGTMGDGQGQQSDAAQTAVTEALANTGIDNLFIRIYQGLRAAGSAFWEQFSGRGSGSEAVPVFIDLGATPTIGAGDDEPEESPDMDVEVEVIDPQEPVSFAGKGTVPQVLIYHTHTHESFAKTDGQNYTESAKWRTTDNDYNIVRVGEELARTLYEKYGIAVLHDKTDNEYPQLGTAYARSLKTMQKNLDANKDLVLLVDLHRDAYHTGIDPSAATIDGQQVARVMAVVGTGEGKTGTGFTLRPAWQQNKKMADNIIDRLAQFDPNLVRKTSVKTGRYNQHLSTGAVLLEVGHNKNTLDEALAAVPYLAQAIAETLADMPGEQTTPSTKKAAPATATPSPIGTLSIQPTATPVSSDTGTMPVATPTPVIFVELEPVAAGQSNSP